MPRRKLIPAAIEGAWTTAREKSRDKHIELGNLPAGEPGNVHAYDVVPASGYTYSTP